MTDQITISIWTFLLLVTVTALAVLDRIFLPGVRWFLRRKINRVIDEINTRLDIEIRPFQITKRQVLIDRLIYDPKVIQMVQDHAVEENKPREIVQAEVLGYAREIVPTFNAYLYFRMGYWLAKKIARMLYWVRVGLVDNEQLASIDTNSTVVFVMNHRSNMDYILVAFMVAERTALSFAVGEWAKIWPLQTLLRSMGAFFVRRDSGNRLYRLVLERYVHMATKEGVCQAVFLEGGLSQDGRLRPPKLGFVDYMLRSFDPETDRDIIFIPVGINYDRTLEDRSLLRALDPLAQKRSVWFVAKTTAGFMWRSLMLMILSRWHRFGYACVNFGPHISAREYCKRHGVNLGKIDRDARFTHVERICGFLMSSIAEIIPVLPVSLVATVMLRHSRKRLDGFEVEARVHELIDDLQKRGAPVYVSRRARAQTILYALNMLKQRRLVVESEGFFQADPGATDILSYYANSIAHWTNLVRKNNNTQTDRSI